MASRAVAAIARQYRWRGAVNLRGRGCTMAGILAIGAVVTGCLWDPNPASASGSQSTTESSVQRMVDSIAAVMEDIRGAGFDRRVCGRLLTDAEWSEYQTGIFDSSWQGTYFEDYSVELFQLGFTRDSTFDFAQEYQEVYGSGVAGFYVPGSDSLYVVGYDQDLSQDQRDNLHSIVAHELVHALQDQHLHAFDSTIESSVHCSWLETDFDLAHQHVVEGDAEFCRVLFIYGHQLRISPASQYARAYFSDVRSDYLDVASQDSFPQPFFLNYVVYSPYINGPYRVGNIYQAGGNSWSGVDDLFSRTNLTMAEIITGEQVTPRCFPTAQLRDALRASSSLYWDDDNLGALLIIALLAPRLSAQEAADALGWAGDYLLYVRHARDSLGSMVWAFSFTDKTSADRFYALLGDHVVQRFDTAAPACSLAGEEWSSDSLYFVQTYEGSSLQTQLVQSDDEVYWLENAGGQWADMVDILVSSRNQPLAKAPAARPRAPTKVPHTPRGPSLPLLLPKLKEAERLIGRNLPTKG
ncbi:MAG: hypothetical protein GF418_03295 [Chitinivibrionales bacterium]|nr:hypothetical protein [Chitinivibrionales bacterium]MBD3394628.1 hypothetical protein [Chitinivibrionales bacterium]